MTSIFETADFAPYRTAWSTRIERYRRYRDYYLGRAYAFLRQVDPLLYKGTKALYSPIRRAVRVDIAKVPAGWRPPEDTPAGLLRTLDEVRSARGALAPYRRFVMYGSVAGEAALLMSGNRAAPVVTAHRPDEIVLGELPDRTPFALIVKRQALDQLDNELLDPRLRRHADEKTYEYAQVITPERISTYRDGRPFAYAGGRSTMPNAFGEIRLVFRQYIEGENGIGEPSFGGALELLDRVNEMASLMLDVLQRNAEPLMVVSGASGIQRDPGSDALLIKDPAARAYTVNPQLAISETLAFIQDVRSEFKTLLPQLSLDQLVARSDLAYETVITMLMELADHIVAVRENVDPAIEQIDRWLLGDAVPIDYRLWRERRWMALSESAQLDLELKRLQVQQQRRALTAPAPQPTAQAADKETRPDGPERRDDDDDAGD